MNFPAAHALSGSPALPGQDPSDRPPLVVFAALRWNFDWQRPQQLLTRLAMHYRVFYVEAPLTTHQDRVPRVHARWRRGVEVLVPHTRCDARGFHDDQFPAMAACSRGFMRERGIVEPLVWIDTPAALPLVEALNPRGVVYDCHDDVAAAVRRRPPARARGAADASWPTSSWPAARRCTSRIARRHANVHCIANAVDAAHFAPPHAAAASPSRPCRRARSTPRSRTRAWASSA